MLIQKCRAFLSPIKVKSERIMKWQIGKDYVLCRDIIGPATLHINKKHLHQLNDEGAKLLRNEKTESMLIDFFSFFGS